MLFDVDFPKPDVSAPQITSISGRIPGTVEFGKWAVTSSLGDRWKPVRLKEPAERAWTTNHSRAHS